MFCISISHKKAPAYIREQYALSREERGLLISTLIEKDIADGGIMLCTCNRCELYVSKESAIESKNQMLSRIQEAFAHFKQISVKELTPYLNLYANESAVNHLFKVCAGLESKILGEDEILRQVKDAYTEAKEAGLTTYELNIMFQKAVTCAKKIKTETGLSSIPVSITTLAANEVFHLKKQGKKIVLLLGGTGRIGSSIAKNLCAKEDITVIAAVRNHSKIAQDNNAADNNAGENNKVNNNAGDNNTAVQILTDSDNLHWIPYAERYQYIDQADVVISCTSSPHFTITREETVQSVRTIKHRLFMDLAMPRDIEPEIGNLPQTTLYNIDYFDTVSAHNSIQKLAKADQARLVLKEEQENAQKEIEFHRCFDKIPEWKTLFEELPLEKLLYVMKKNLDLDSMRTVLLTFDSLGRWTRKE